MKRVSQIIAKFILMILALHLLAISIIWTKNRIYLGTVNSTNIDYLRKNMEEVDISAPLESRHYGILDKYAKNTQLFLLGENHGVADVQKVDKNIFLSLHRNHGVRYYVAEMDSSLSNRLNAFLAGPAKDEKILGAVVSEIRKTIPQQSSTELFEKWSDIYDYNRNLPDSLKISVLGIDRGRSALPRTTSRDSAMFDNFVSQVKRNGLEKERFYGLLGFAHVLQAPVGKNRYTHFAAIAKASDYDFANRITSIVCYTLDSETYLPKNGNFPTPPDERTGMLNADGPITLVKGIKDLEEVTESKTVTLFDLDSDGSPYRKEQYLAGAKVNFFGGDVLPSDLFRVTTDYFQCVLLVRDSGALNGFQ